MNIPSQELPDMQKSITQMRLEILEIPDAVERLLSEGHPEITKIASKLREMNPRFLLSVARGSSDHAATFLKYASELLLGLPMASVGPSIKSIYGVTLASENSACIAISQSGKSPDIVTLAESFTQSGSFTIAITNEPQSPLASVCDATLSIRAGSEMSVAATKSFVTSKIAGLWLLAETKQDEDLRRAIHALPTHLAAAIDCDWSPVAQAIHDHSLFTLGRGPSWAIANEAALKFKETCQIHAESYSSAEFLHGPVSIVESGFPVLLFVAGDAAESNVAKLADEVAKKGAMTFATTQLVSKATCLPHIRTDHWITDPIALIVSFYGLVETIAVHRGTNPDAPRHLKKVTQTL